MICKIQFKNKNDNKLFDVVPGETFSDTYNEELDSATTRSVHFRNDSKLDIEPYDSVLLCTDTKINGLFEKEKIIDEKTWYYHLFLVNDIDITQVSVEENPYYNYIITLISPIKELEGIILPNLKITQVWGRSGANGYLEAVVEYVSPTQQPRDEVHVNFDIPEVKNEVYVEGISYLTVLKYRYEDETGDIEEKAVIQLIVPKVEKVNYFDGTATVKFSYPTEINGVVPIDMKLTAIINFRYKRSIYHYLSQYVEEYSTTIRKQSKNGILTQKFTLSDEVRNKFREIICPEMQWNNPTLRQVLNDLMMIKDCIPVIREYGVIDFIDLSKIDSTPVDMKYINFINSHRSGAEYTSELHMELRNVLQSNVDNINNVITVTEYCSARASIGHEITSNNIVLKVQNPIYEIENVVLCGVAHLNFNEGTATNPVVVQKEWWNEVDITPYIFEKKEFDTLNIKYVKPPYTIVSESDLGAFQNTSLYYTRGSQNIENLTVETTIFDIGFTFPLIQAMAFLLFEKNLIGKAKGVSFCSKYNSLLFKITYKTPVSCLFRASKNGSNNKKITIDNQTNSYIDPYSQGLLEYMKANRIGNEQKTATARYDLAHLDKIAKLGQTIDGAIVFKREISFHRDYAVVNYSMTPNYVLKDYYTGIRAKIRSWKIVDGNDALERHDIRKFYICLSDKNHTDDIILSNIPNCDSAWFFTSFIWQIGGKQDGDYKIQLAKFGLFQCNIRGNSTSFPTVGYYSLDLSSRIVGMSLCFTMGFRDNYVAGTSVQKVEWDWKNGIENFIRSEWQNDLKYGDGNGEFLLYKFYITAFLNLTDDILIPKNQTTIYHSVNQTIFKDETQFLKPLLENSVALPFVKASNVDKYYCSVTFPFHKDNSEITRGTVQFEMLSDNINMYYLGNAFMLWQQTLRTDNKMPILKLFSGSKDEFADRRKDDLPTNATSVEFSIVRDLGSKKFTLYAIDTTFNTENAYFLTDNLNRVVLAFKAPENTNSVTFYFNVLENLDLNVYDDEGYVVK